MKIQSLNKKIIASIIAFLVFTCSGVLVMIGFILTRSDPNQPERVVSPSGKRVVIPTVNTSKEDITNYLCIKIEIQDVATGETLFEEQTGASNRMRWSIHWVKENNIQLRSSDIGVLCWEEGSDNVWRRVDCLY
jgi:hypothetical protein